MKNCPFCSEKIQEGAKKCKFCKEWLSGDKATDSGNEKKKEEKLSPMDLLIKKQEEEEKIFKKKQEEEKGNIENEEEQFHFNELKKSKNKFIYTIKNTKKRDGLRSYFMAPLLSIQLLSFILKQNPSLRIYIIVSLMGIVLTICKFYVNIKYGNKTFKEYNTINKKIDRIKGIYLLIVSTLGSIGLLWLLINWLISVV